MEIRRAERAYPHYFFRPDCTLPATVISISFDRFVVCRASLLKLSIGHRLFLTVLLSIAVVASIGVELVRWKLFDNFAPRAANTGSEPMDGLADALSARYRQHHDWSFLPADQEQRKTRLRGLVRLQEGQDAKAGARRPAAAMEYRIGLLDRDGHYLAGAIASPLTIAYASIDRIRHVLIIDGEIVGYLVVARPQNPDDALAVAFLIDQQKNIFIVAAIGVLLSAMAAALLAMHFRRPIRQLVEGARKLEHARFDTRLAIKRSDELGELADTFNHLAAKLEDTERSRRQWVADTSHELRTPLSVLRGQMEALQDGVRTATPDNIAIMLRQIQSLTKLVDDLRELAYSDVGQLSCGKTAVDVWPLVVEAADAFSEKIRAAQLAATIGSPPALSIVRCDADRMRQVVANLLENCVRYTDPGGRIEVHAVVFGDELRIDIDDSAPCVSAQSLDRLGERFFRVESSRSRQLGGAGLGLALCRQIVGANDGRLEFSPSPLGGLRATIALKLEA